MTNRKYIINEKYFDCIDTQNKAYILGFLTADGHINKLKQTLRISLKDKCILDFIQSELGGKVWTRFRIQKETGTIKTVHEYQANSTYLVRQLVNLGFRNKPELSDELIPSFLLGFLDGDGCIYHYKRLFQITFTANYDFNWIYYVNLINKLGIFKTNISSQIWINKYNGKLNSSSRLRLLGKNGLDFCSILYNNHNGFCLDRKKQKYLQKMVTT